MIDEAVGSEKIGQAEKLFLPFPRQCGERPSEKGQTQVMVTSVCPVLQISAKLGVNLVKARKARSGLHMLRTVNASARAAMEGQENGENTSSLFCRFWMAKEKCGHGVGVLKKPVEKVNVLR